MAAISALGHATSGSLGTALATAAVAPIDLVTTRLKTQTHADDDSDPESATSSAQYKGLVDAFRKIVKDEGFSALYSGAGTDIAKSVLDSFLFFGFYNYLRTLQPNGQRKTVLQEIALGSVAGACSKAITTPLSNVVARKQTSASDQTLLQILKGLKQEGGLWAGYSATLVLTLNPSLTFLMNRRLAKRILPLLEDDEEIGDVPVAWAAFLLAAISKATATAIMYPFQTAKTKLQLHPDGEQDDEKPSEKARKAKMAGFMKWLHSTIIGVILGIVGKEGIRALFAGMQGELLKGFFSHGLTMFSKGLIHRLVVKAWLNRAKVLKTKA